MDIAWLNFGNLNRPKKYKFHTVYSVEKINLIKPELVGQAAVFKFESNLSKDELLPVILPFKIFQKEIKKFSEKSMAGLLG